MAEQKTVQVSATQAVSYEVEYFRSYGIHMVSDNEGDVHIFSFPDWEGLEAALLHDLPDEGTIVTTECATFTGPHEQLPGNERLIEERTQFAQEQSTNTQADIWLGTFATPLSTPAWFNRVVYLNNGEQAAQIDKTRLSPYEEWHSPVTQGSRDALRTIRNGRSVIICSEAIIPNAIHFDRGPLYAERTLLMPTCWAAVSDDPGWDEVRQGWIKKYGSADAYFRDALENVVAQTLHKTLARHVIVADRNVSGSDVKGPFNAHFREIA